MASLALIDVDKEQRHFFGLIILLYDVGNKSLRKYFKTQWLVVYKKLKGTLPLPWADVPNDATQMNGVETKLKLKANEKLKFDNGDTRCWDFSLLSSVLLHSSLGFISLPPEKKALEDLKDVRNDLVGHIASCKIDDATFKSAWTTTCNALKLFGASQPDFDSVEDVLQKPSGTLVQLLKQYVAKDEDIKDILSKVDDKMDKYHKEDIDQMNQHHEDVKEFIKEQGQLTRSLIKECLGRQPSRHILMEEDQRLLLQQRLLHFQDEVIATDLIGNLPCLTDEQKDQITYDEKNYLSSKAVKTLVEKLEEHEEGFHQFVQALRKADLGHVAVILDADFEGHECDDKTKAGDESKYYAVVGTAVDVMIPMSILDEKKVRQLNIEEKIASTFSNSSSPDSKKLRKDFQKVLPNGVQFVHTKQLGSHDNTREASNTTSSLRTSKKDSVVFVFRVAKVGVLDELWKSYQETNLNTKLHKVLSSKISISWSLSLEMNFQEKDYIAIKRILEGHGEEPETEINSAEDPEPSISCQVDSEFPADKDDTESIKQDPGSEVLNTEATPKIKSVKFIPRVYLDDGTYNLSREIKLRDYQKELATSALEGKNTIICAPTNSGKTFVAMEIAKKLLDSNKGGPDEACKPSLSRTKVIFAVDKQNLVLQQRARFDEYLKNYSISDISGNNSNVIPLHRLMHENDVVVLTAQILINALRDKSVSISDISLLVFDECHHANKDHPYNQIMQIYLDLKIKKNVKELPQVVGLTASLGVGQSNTVTQAKEHILQMCANLDASNISTVQENTEDLINHVTGHVPVRRVIPPVNRDVQNIFEIEVNKTLQEIEGFVKNLLPNPRTLQAVHATTDRQCEGYRQWIELLQNNTEITDNRTRFTCADQLRKYHEALLINNTVRINDALQYLEEYFDTLDQSKFTDNCARLQELYTQTMKRIQDYITENGKPDNPLLKVLEKLILNFHEKQETEAKGILFTRTRDYTVALKRWINETKDLDEILRPEVLVGSGDGEIGLSQTQQESVIKKFKSGEINIIIATTVAEEGLDISDCSYVIRYGMLGNEISSVQSRGRIRAKEGNYVYVPDSRRRGVEHEIRNDYREMLMDSGLEEVQNMEKKLFSDGIIDLQVKILNDLQIQKGKEAEKKSQFNEEDNISFLCKKCEKYVCSTREIRRYKSSNHLVVNPNVDKLFVVRERKPPEGHRDKHFNKYKVYCKDCDLDWGIQFSTQHVGWLCLKIVQFWIVFNDRTDHRMKRNIQKWKEAPFEIEEVSLVQLFELRKLFGQNRE